MKGGVDGLMLDSAPPTAGKSSKKRGGQALQKERRVNVGLDDWYSSRQGKEIRVSRKTVDVPRFPGVPRLSFYSTTISVSDGAPSTLYTFLYSSRTSNGVVVFSSL